MMSPRRRDRSAPASHSLDDDIARLRQRLSEAEAGALRNDSAPTGELDAASPLEATSIPAAFQREIFRIGDSRLAATDAQAGILIAAAVAVATFTGGLVKNGHVHPPGLVVTGALAILVTTMALYARRERPRWPGKRGTKMHVAGDLARVRVNQVHDLVRSDHPSADAIRAASAEFNAWHALADSITSRREVKDRCYVAAIAVLLIEVCAAIWTALSVNPV
jgi:hypothetical protein